MLFCSVFYPLFLHFRGSGPPAPCAWGPRPGCHPTHSPARPQLLLGRRGTAEKGRARLPTGVCLSPAGRPGAEPRATNPRGIADPPALSGRVRRALGASEAAGPGRPVGPPPPPVDFQAVAGRCGRRQRLPARPLPSMRLRLAHPPPPAAGSPLPVAAGR